MPANGQQPPAQPRQSRWEMVKSFAFRMLMFYFITQFFRRSSTNPSTANTTLPANPTTGYAPGNLFAHGDLLVINFLMKKKQFL